MSEWLNPRFAIALVIVALFAWAYGSNVGDQTMIGALIGAFNMAIGYYLGSSNSSNAVREQVGKALDLAAAAQPGPEPQQVIVANAAGDPVPVEQK